MENTNEIEVKTIMTDAVVFDVTTANINELREKYKDFPTDLTVKENYEVVRLGVGEIKKIRGRVEVRRKELKADALAYGHKVDSAAKEIKKALLEIETPMAQLKKDFDTQAEIEKREAARKEEERIDTIHSAIASIKSLVEQNISADSDMICAVIDGLKIEKPETWADEFIGKAQLAISETIGKLEELYKMKVQNEEAERIAAQKEEEAEALRIAEAKRRAEEEKKRAEELAAKEKEMAAREAELAENQRVIDEQAAKLREAEEAKRIEAERVKREAEEKIAREKKEAEEAKRIEAERKENERLAKVAADNAQKNFDNTVEALSVYMESSTAILILNGIKGGDFKHIKWVA